MRKSSPPYTEAEKALAKQLFARAQADGTLKPRPGLIAVAFGSGDSASASRDVAWRDYLRDARAMLSRPRPGRARR